jgi:hypothetical protein
VQVHDFRAGLVSWIDEHGEQLDHQRRLVEL